MPIRLTPLVTDHFYHIYNRGVNKIPIFNTKRDYIRALNLLKFYNFKDHPVKFSRFKTLSRDARFEIWNRLEKSSRYTSIISYCLMPNHYHLLLRQKLDNGISKLMADFQNSYARYFNTKNERIGPLFQGQFKAKIINIEETLMHVSRYIHLNPYSSGLVKAPEDLTSYPYSSYPEYLNLANFPLCEREIILSYFKDSKSYKNFVMDRADYQKDLERIKHLTLE